jgi:hypothetical protein
VALRTTLQQVVDVPAQIVQMQREMPSVTSAEEHAQVIESIYATLLYR